MIEGMTVLTESTVDEYIADRDCIILFFKKICPHCKVLMTVLQKCMAQSPNLQIAGIDSEEQAALMERFGAERVPTVIAIKKGEAKAKKVGVMNPREMMDFFAKA